MPPTPIQKANARVERLRQSSLDPASEPEDLDKPLDPDIRIQGVRLDLMVGDTAVSGADVYDLRQQMGSQVLRMGGVGYVKTHDDFRFKGYSRRVMENVLRHIRREGYDAAMLYGIPQFYPKFGFATAFPDVRHTIATRDAERAEPAGYKFVRFQPRYLKPLLRMYHNHIQGTVGPTLRDPKRWTGWPKGLGWFTKADCRVALDNGGRPVGYYVRHVENLTAKFQEVGFSRPDAMPDILRRMARAANQQRLEKIELYIPEDHPFIAYIQPLGLTKAVRYRQDGEAMVRLVNVPSALGKLAPDLARRAPGAGRLTIRTNLDNAQLTWGRGKMTVGKPRPGAPVARLPQWALARLVYGYSNASSLANLGVLKATKPTVDILNSFFPTTPHFHYHADHF